MDKDLEEKIELLKNQPGAPLFAEVAFRLVSSKETRTQAREICLRGLAREPDNLKGRLALAKSFYLDSLPEFCVRELVELKSRKSFPSLQRLIDAFGSLGRKYDSLSTEVDYAEEEEVLGDVDFEAELADVLDEIEDD